MILRHIENDEGKPIELVTLSSSPRIFTVTNFFTDDDSDQLINNALAITDPEFMLKRSTTGTKGKEVSGGGMKGGAGSSGVIVSATTTTTTPPPLTTS